MLFISHDLDVVRAVSDRVLVMHQGRIVEEGTTKDVYEAPKEAYTKELMGAFYYDRNTPDSTEEFKCF